MRTDFRTSDNASMDPRAINADFRSTPEGRPTGILAPSQTSYSTHKRKHVMSAVLSNSPAINPNKALWEKGDFTRIAATMRESGESLVRSIGVKKGMKVLDLGGGDGTTALPAARLGAEVLVVDIARNLVAAGNKRASEAGLSNLKFQEGDATDLQGLKNQSFDLVVSIF